MIKLFLAYPLLVAGGLIAVVFTLLANRHRTEHGKSRPFTPLSWRSRDHFTPIGWRYRNCANVFGYIAALSVIIPLLYAQL